MRILLLVICFLPLLTGICIGVAQTQSDSVNFNAFLQKADPGQTEALLISADESLSGFAPAILSILYMVGIATAVVVITVYGIQWLTANSAKKAELKAALVPLLIGMILLFAGVKLAESVFSILLSTF